MKKNVLLMMVFIPVFFYSQERKFNKFELLHNIPQQISNYYEWPKFGLGGIQLFQDTLFTFLAKTNCLTSFPILNKEDKPTHLLLKLPKKSFPIALYREKNKWYFINQRDGAGFLTDNGCYINIINQDEKQNFQNIFLLNDRILLFDSDGYEGLFALYDLNGNLLNSTERDIYTFKYPTIYKNRVMDGYSELIIESDTIKVLETFDFKKYGKENIYIGGYKNFGYFVNWDSRDCLVIRNLDDKSTQERFIIPVKFKDSDLGIPEEGCINLRVFSEDNNTFYFVTLKHGHLLIYKAVR